MERHENEDYLWIAMDNDSDDVFNDGDDDDGDGNYEDLMMEEEEILMLVTLGISKIRIREAIYRWPYSYIDVFIIEI